MRVFLQFAAGLGPLVEHALTMDFGTLRTVYEDDSGIMMDVSAERARVASLQYVKNSFLVLDEVPRTSLPADVDGLARRLRAEDILPKESRKQAFRVMFSVDGQLVAVPAPSRQRLVAAIEARTRGALNARGGSGTEFWLIGRRDLDTVLFCERLSTGPTGKAERGALATDLSTLLVLASEPRPDDVFLDPFGGSGTLVAARALWPARSLTYSDVRARQHAPSFSLRGRAGPQVRVLDEDARALPSVPDDSVDAIVTDPPWGEYEELEQPYPAFAEGVLAAFRRVLKDPARVVLLLSRRSADVFAELFPGASLTTQRRLDVLVNGHPATVLVARHS